MKAVETEFEALGMLVSIRPKVKSHSSNIESTFLKSETIWKELILESTIPQISIEQKANIKIKLEVDTKPPLGFETEELLLLKPFSFYVKCFKLRDLFAGKMHALLFRPWKTIVKGRDWYDMEWYIRKGVHLNLDHFLKRARDSGSLQKETITGEEFRKLLGEKIESVNFNRIKDDITRFIPDAGKLDIWSPQYFQDLTKQIKIE